MPEQMLTTVILWIAGVAFLVLDLLLPTALWLGGSWEDPFFVIWQVWWWAVTGIPLFAIAWVTWFVHLIWAAMRDRRFKRAPAPGSRGSPR